MWRDFSGCQNWPRRPAKKSRESGVSQARVPQGIDHKRQLSWPTKNGIQIVYRPPLQPHFGGHVERLIGTLMGEVHLLPGTTFRSVAKRGTYHSAGQAAMRLAEWEAWLAWQIAGVYHLRPHAALGGTPLAAWQKGMERMRTPVREPSDPKRFYLDFLPFEHQAQQRLEKGPVFAPLVKQRAVANPEPDNPVDPFPFEIWHE